jgi:hypothetical protein
VVVSMAARLGLSVFATAATASAVLAVCLAAPALATPSTHVNWKETWKVQGVPVLSFAVSSISIGKTTWTARVSFHNLLHTALGMPSNSFGIAFYPSAKLTPTTQPVAFGIAKSFSNGRPTRLAPGGSWTGVISGPGRPKITGKTWARIVFGPFAGLPGKQRLALWITDHSLVLKLGSKSSVPLVI